LFKRIIIKGEFGYEYSCLSLNKREELNKLLEPYLTRRDYPKKGRQEGSKRIISNLTKGASYFTRALLFPKTGKPYTILSNLL